MSLEIRDPYDILKSIPEYKSIFLSHGDLRGDYGDQIVFSVAYRLLKCKTENIITSGNVKNFDLGTNSIIPVDQEYLHGILSLEDIPEYKAYESFRNLVHTRLSDVGLPKVDAYFGRGGSYFYDTNDWLTLHRLAEMLYYAESGIPVYMFPFSAFYKNAKLLDIFVNVARQCKLLMIRDPMTYKWMESLGFKDNIVQSYDLIFLENPAVVESKSNIGIVLTSDLYTTKNFENYLETDVDIVVFSTSPKRDEKRSRYIATQTRGVYRYVNSISDLLSTVASCSTIVTDKYYGLALAMLHDIPCVCLKSRSQMMGGLLTMKKELPKFVSLNKKLEDKNGSIT